jgi:hypothetical protein
MILERAEWALSGVSKDEMAERSKASAKANIQINAALLVFL